ncbi:unnamed protein product [Adineta ricciae]|uniref:Lipoma HMGIC fusion partner-like 3 protein n=1 Tax=Adineta ricciae TaxID=249248 RepID=A0A813XUT3_ADIRI|nr:unnamed protein product [Adineta ricciae]CAF0878670.1 unnamed protein product [Adineta ricciae]
MMKNITRTRAVSYKWISRVIGIVWAFLTACFAILNIYVFVQPQWIGDTLESPRAGHFGLYSHCISTTSDYEFDCRGTWTNFGTILNSPFAVATFFIGFSALLILICLAAFILFLFIRARIVYFICASIQIVCAICFLIALIIYPSGFDNDTVRSVCGPNANDFYIDTCQVRWAYIVAIIGFFNILILAILAFSLAVTQPISTVRHDNLDTKPVLSKYGEVNGAFDDRTFSDQRHELAI